MPDTKLGSDKPRAYISSEGWEDVEWIDVKWEIIDIVPGIVSRAIFDLEDQVAYTHERVEAVVMGSLPYLNVQSYIEIVANHRAAQSKYDGFVEALRILYFTETLSRGA